MSEKVFEVSFRLGYGDDCWREEVDGNFRVYCPRVWSSYLWQVLGTVELPKLFSFCVTRNSLMRLMVSGVSLLEISFPFELCLI